MILQGKGKQTKEKSSSKGPIKGQSDQNQAGPEGNRVSTEGPEDPESPEVEQKAPTKSFLMEYLNSRSFSEDDLSDSDGDEDYIDIPSAALGQDPAVEALTKFIDNEIIETLRRSKNLRFNHTFILLPFIVIISSEMWYKQNCLIVWNFSVGIN